MVPSMQMSKICIHYYGLGYLVKFIVVTQYLVLWYSQLKMTYMYDLTMISDFMAPAYRSRLSNLTFRHAIIDYSCT